MSKSDPNYVETVKTDFGILAKSYDLINNFMSFGTDRQFRYLAIKNTIHDMNESSDAVWLDIGTGTGHLANELNKQKDNNYVVGLDVSAHMMNMCRDRQIFKVGLLNLILADGSKTPFRRASFDGLISGFVGRHYRDYPTTLSDHHRIVKPLGRIMMLEMGRRATKMAFFIDVYVGRLMSTFGKLAAFLLTGGKAPFRLLENSYKDFFSPRELIEFYDDAGFRSRYKLLLMGSIVIVLGLRLP
ncbi:MAG: class I SAM-dependent methyltransferase [Candidatus Heimdallarchaeota archaeon]|nr:class I SAM-dependent methyltransferase [Candidatus Heimdallarchaeota archaeon]